VHRINPVIVSQIPSMPAGHSPYEPPIQICRSSSHAMVNRF
jgi:hypothetical protein